MPANFTSTLSGHSPVKESPLVLRPESAQPRPPDHPQARSAAGWPVVVGLWILLLTIWLGGWAKMEITQPVDGDAIGFLPQILQFKLDGRLVNEIYADVFPYASVPDGRHVWHGILFPLLTACLIPRADYDSVARVILGYEMVTLVAMGLMLIQMRPKNRLQAAAMLCAPVVVITWQAGLFGRPELLAIMFSSVGLAAFLRARPSFQPWIAGITIGLVAATSPIPGALLGLTYAAYLPLVGGRRAALRAASIAAVLSLLLFFATFAFYPYTIREWFTGTLRHADDSVVGYVRQSFLGAWFWKEDRPFMLVWLAGFSFSTWLSFRRSVYFTSWRTGFLGFAALGVAFAAYTSPDGRNYNVAALAPIILIGFHHVAWRSRDYLPRWKHHVVALTVILMTAISAVPLVRQSLLKLHSHHGLDRETASAILGALRKSDLHVAVSRGLFILCEDTRLMHTLSPGDYLDQATLRSDADLVLIQQINPYKPVPASYTNYALERNYFTTYVPRLWGVPLAKSPRAFNFAVYRKLPVDTSAIATLTSPLPH